jgi:RNA polymerase sigma-70 factor (ECF subfamily)
MRAIAWVANAVGDGFWGRNSSAGWRKEKSGTFLEEHSQLDGVHFTCYWTISFRIFLKFSPCMIPPDSSPPDSDEEAEKRERNERDVSLMLKVKEGDMQAFELLVELHQGAVIGTVAKMLGGAAEAEDIAQQVFIRVWKSAGRYEPQAKFTTWLFTITRNLVFNETRRRKRKPTVSVEEREEVSHRQVEDGHSSSPAEDVLHAELEKAVDDAIQSLPEKQRLAVVLRRYEEMPYEEIGSVLGMSIPAVKSLLFRARTQLKETLQRYLDQ